jgi:hypothetical protein
MTDEELAMVSIGTPWFCHSQWYAYAIWREAGIYPRTPLLGIKDIVADWCRDNLDVQPEIDQFSGSAAYVIRFANREEDAMLTYFRFL